MIFLPRKIKYQVGDIFEYELDNHKLLRIILATTDYTATIGKKYDGKIKVVGVFTQDELDERDYKILKALE